MALLYRLLKMKTQDVIYSLTDWHKLVLGSNDMDCSSCGSDFW